MERSRFSEEPVAHALRQVEAGTPVADVCRQLGLSEATFCAWKRKYAPRGVSELRRLRELDDENARLKRRGVAGDVSGQLCAGRPRAAAKYRTFVVLTRMISARDSGRLVALCQSCVRTIGHHRA
jgi:putative transposase